MIVRKLDKDGDWSYGNSIKDYLVNIDAVAQNVKTRLKEYLGDCFFDLLKGIDWDTRLGGKNQEDLLKSDTYSIIKNTDGVLGILNHELTVVNRIAYIKSKVETVYGQITIEVSNGR